LQKQGQYQRGFAHSGPNARVERRRAQRLVESVAV
jgi:hypothetical protein